MWIVYPQCELVDDGDLKLHTLGLDDTLGGGEVLPGFSIVVKAISPGLIQWPYMVLPACGKTDRSDILSFPLV